MIIVHIQFRFDYEDIVTENETALGQFYTEDLILKIHYI